MINARSLRYIVTMYILILTICTSMALLTPLSRAEEGSDGGSSGGSSGGSTGGTTGGGSTGGGTAGAYLGHETVKMIAVVTYMLKHMYTTLPITPTPSDTTALTDREKEFLCSMGRLKVYDSYAKNIWFPAYLAGILGRPVSVVADAMEWTSCPSRKR